MVYCAKSKTAKKRTWCKKTPCAVDNDTKSCAVSGANRCRVRISKKALPKKKMSKIQKKTKKMEKAEEVVAEVVEEVVTPRLRRSPRLNTAKGVSSKPMSKKASRAKVFNNKELVTPGGLSTKDLVKSNGRIVSKVKSKIGKKNGWALAVKKARKELKIKGFAVIKKGEPIYDLAKKYYKGSVGGAAVAAGKEEEERVICVKKIEQPPGEDGIDKETFYKTVKPTPAPAPTNEPTNEPTPAAERAEEADRLAGEQAEAERLEAERAAQEAEAADRAAAEAPAADLPEPEAAAAAVQNEVAAKEERDDSI